MIKIVFALVSVCFLVQACEELQYNNVNLLFNQRQVLEWHIVLEKDIGLKCFTFELATQGDIHRIFFQVTPRKEVQRLYPKFKKIMMFVTNSTIQQEEEFTREKFIGNEYMDKIIASDLDGVFSDQKSAKIFYQQNQQGKKRYYVYLRSSLSSFLSNYGSLVPYEFEKDYQLLLVFNPKDTDLCNGFSTEQNECRCKDENKITLHCNVDVKQLSFQNTDQVLSFNANQFNNSQVFLYLNHTELYQHFSEESRFQLKISKKKSSSEQKLSPFFVYDKFLNKSNTNDQLPLMEAAYNFYNIKNKNTKISQIEHLFVIKKEKNDRIFSLRNLGIELDFEVSLKLIEEDFIQITSTNQAASQEIEGEDKQETEDLWYRNSYFYCIIIAVVILMILIISSVILYSQKQNNKYENDNLALETS